MPSMSTITTPDSNVTVWLDRPSWREPTLDQKLETVSVGEPESPAETGRRAVHDYAEDLRRLAES